MTGRDNAAAEEIRRYAANHPDADAMDILAQLGLGPAHRATAEAILAGEEPEPITEPETTGTDDTSGEIDTGSDTQAGGGAGSAAGGESASRSADNTDDPAQIQCDDTAAHAALEDVIEFFHRRLDDEITDHTPDGEHPERPTTAREYFTDVRGWDGETIDEQRLGWAPAYARDELIAWLFDRGHDREAMLATGVIGESDDGRLYVSWKGRYVLPYFDADARPIYAIARCTGNEGGGGKGYDGHPADYQAGKYSKLRHTDDRVPFTEPIWGLDTLEDGTPVVIAEGIADAITAAEAGYSVLSPVTKEFKREHIPPLRDAIADHDVPAVYIVPDADPASFAVPEDAPDKPASIGDALDMPLVPAGLSGGLRSATLLRAAFAENSETPSVQVVDLPQPSAEKVDLDDYLNEWADDLDAVLASAKPPEAFDAYDRATRHMDRGATPNDTTGSPSYATDRAATSENATDRSRARSVDPADPHRSSLWALDMADVTPTGFSRAGDRGRNPAKHKGNSETYFVLREGRTAGDLVATDYKGVGGKAKYNALTYLLVDAGERDRDRPEGALSDREVWLAWKHARETEILPLEDKDGDADGDGDTLPDPVPHKALWHITREHDLADPEAIPTDYDDDGLSTTVTATALDTIRETYGIDPEREAFDATSGRDHEPMAVMPDPPNAPVALAETRGAAWNWQTAAAQHTHERERDDTAGDGHELTLDAVRERTQSAIADAYRYGDRVLVEALMTTGKSYGAIAAAAETNEPVTYLTNRGNSEQYQEAIDRCEEHDLSCKILPSAYRDCPTFRGDHGDEIKQTVSDAYNGGATAKEIHVHAPEHLGGELPCEDTEGGCEWKQKWGAIDPDEVDVLIGHYSHAHVASATKRRTVVFDEFPGDTFETALGGEELAGAISHFLENTPALDIEDYADLMAARDDDQRRADALAWFLGQVGHEHGQPGHDPGLAFAQQGHALAPVATFILLAGGDDDHDLGNGWSGVALDSLGGDDDFDQWGGVYDGENNVVHILRPPATTLQYASGVVALDGTPTKQMWELVLGEGLNHRQVLTEPERIDYLADTLDHTYVRTTDAAKPYSSGNWVDEQGDGVLFDGIAEEYDTKPALITTASAQRAYHRSDEIDFTLDTRTDQLGTDHPEVDAVIDGESSVSAAKHYGDILGSNEFADTRVGVVAGSRHYGDTFVKKWAAFAGEGTERVDATTDGKGAALAYTGFGGAIYRHMTKHQTLQATMRVGRDGLGAVTFVHTNTLPDWVEHSRVTEQRPGVVRTASVGERDVLGAITADDWALDEWGTQEVAAHPDVRIGQRQVRTHLNRLVERGVLDRRYEGTGYVYRDTGLHDVNDRGEIELSASEIDELELDEEAGSEVGRNIIYTWDFRPPGDTGDGDPSSPAVATDGGDCQPSTGGDPPPDDPV